MTGAPSTKPVVLALGGKTVTPPPLWLMRQAGRYLPEYRKLRARAGDFLDFCYTPELAVEATLQPLRRYPLDGAIVFSDILVIPDALGQRVRFCEGQGPVLEALQGGAAIEALDGRGAKAHLAPIYETVARLRDALADDVALIGFAGAPWTLATYMVEGRGGTDLERTRQWAYQEPEQFAALIEVLVEAAADHLIAQVDSGADVVQLFDSWAGALAESQFRRWVIAPTAELVRRVKTARPEVPVIGFPRGAGALYREYAEASGVDSVGLDAGVPVDWAARVLQPRVAVQGNLDNLVLKTGGRVLAEETARIVSGLGGGPFVFNLGHGVLPGTPPGNVARLVRLVRRQSGA